MGSPRLNIHTVKIVRAIVEYGDIPLEELNEHNLVDKTNNLLSHLISNQQDWCLDTVLDIAYLSLQSAFRRLQQARNASVTSSTISKDHAEVGAIAKVLIVAEGLIDNFELCMELLSSSDPVLVEKSIQVIFVILQLFGAQRIPEQRQAYFIEEHMRHLIDAVKVDKITTKKKALKCIMFSLDQDDHPLMLSDEQKAGILTVVEPLLKSNEKSIVNLANKIFAVLNT